MAFIASAFVGVTAANITGTIGVTQGGTGVSTTGGQLPWLPVDNAFLAATASLDGVDNQFQTVAGTLYLLKLPVRASFTCTSLSYIVSTGGSGASTGSFVGLYNSAGTLLSGSADIGANLAVAADYTTALTSAQALTAGTFVWAAMLTNLATTQPTFRAWATPSALVTNIGLAAAPLVATRVGHPLGEHVVGGVDLDRRFLGCRGAPGRRSRLPCSAGPRRCGRSSPRPAVMTVPASTPRLPRSAGRT